MATMAHGVDQIRLTTANRERSTKSKGETDA